MLDRVNNLAGTLSEREPTKITYRVGKLMRLVDFLCFIYGQFYLPIQEFQDLISKTTREITKHRQHF